MSEHEFRSRREFLRDMVEGAVRGGREIVSPLWRNGMVLARDEGTAAEAGPQADRERTGGPGVSGELLAALNDLSGIYES